MKSTGIRYGVKASNMEKSKILNGNVSKQLAVQAIQGVANTDCVVNEFYQTKQVSLAAA